MALSARGKVLTFFVVLLLLGAGVVGFLFLTGNEDIVGLGSGGGDDVPTNCPLTGLKPADPVPDRPALAVKIENLPIARPQAGLEAADIVWEQPVEAGITRFVVIFHCDDADRLGPIRSARLVDPRLLVQLGGNTLFAYAGGVPEVEQAVAESGITDIGFTKLIEPYVRDPNRKQPHNLYSTTGDLYEGAGSPTGVPTSIFEYDARIPQRGKQVTSIHIPFSDTADVIWRWDQGSGSWLRFHGAGSEPHLDETGAQIRAKNVIIQHVQIGCSGIFDVNGACSPEVKVVGGGDSAVFRDGRAVVGKWSRAFEEDITEFLDGNQRRIALAEGNTWIELVPTDVTYTFE